MEGAERFGADPDLRQALAKLARAEDTRGCLLLLSRLVHSPDLVERLMDALRPEEGDAPAPPELGWLQ